MAQGDYIIPGAQAVTEWGSRVGGFINGCGQAALAVIFGIANGTPPRVADVTRLIQQGAQAGYTGQTGVSTLRGLSQLSAANGLPTQIGSGANALGTINANLARGLPTEIGVSNASAFGGSDKNVQGHYVTVVGRAANGNFIVADPNQPQAQSGGFIEYSAAQIQAALPFGTLTPTSLPWPGGSERGIAAGVTPAVGGLFDAFHTSGPDFAWRAGLIIGGVWLIIWGLVIFFSHQETTIVETVGGQVSGAVKSAAAAAAA